jgi:hypothetical protein
VTPQERNALKTAVWECPSGDSGTCFEAAKLPTGNIAIRNRKAPDIVIVGTPEEWASFAAGFKGDFFTF